MGCLTCKGLRTTGIVHKISQIITDTREMLQNISFHLAKAVANECYHCRLIKHL